GRALHAEDARRAVVAADAPADALEHRQDVTPLDLVERARRPGYVVLAMDRRETETGAGTDDDAGRPRARGGARERLVDLQAMALRQDHGALHDVLELAHVAR